MACVCSSLERGWVRCRDDTEENLRIRTTHGQLPVLIHLPYRHFLSFSMLAKLLLLRGGGDKGYIYRETKGPFSLGLCMDTNSYIEIDNVLFDSSSHW